MNLWSLVPGDVITCTNTYWQFNTSDPMFVISCKHDPCSGSGIQVNMFVISCTKTGPIIEELTIDADDADSFHRVLSGA